MKLLWTEQGWEDYSHWQQTDQAMIGKINALIKDTLRSPSRGLGKPEPLRRDMSGWWSRRITGEHRLIYGVGGSGNAQALEIAACRFHYK